MAQVTFKNGPVTLVGNEVKVGDQAPDFTVLANDLSPVTLNDSEGKIRLFSLVPSLDTGVCDAQTRRFNEEAANLGDNVVIYSICGSSIRSKALVWCSRYRCSPNCIRSPRPFIW